jgi:hypothetical protein
MCLGDFAVLRDGELDLGVEESFAIGAAPAELDVDAILLEKSVSAATTS